MVRRRRVLWHSDAPWARTGYAGQTRLMARSLASAGFEVTLSAVAGSDGGATTWEGFDVLPSPNLTPNALRTWMDDILDRGQGDVVVTLVNLWRLAHEDIVGWPVLSWVPVDSDPVPEADAEHLRTTQPTVLSMSSFGSRSLQAAGLDPVEVPHGIDTSVFSLLVDGDRATSRSAARRRLGIEEGDFVVGVVAANEDADANRKSLPEIVRAVADLATVHPDVLLYLHTDLTPGPSGLDVRELLNGFAGAGAESLRVMATAPARYRRGLPDTEMAVLYNAFDVLCAPSAGEGFCLPMVEAQACGVPVVGTRASAQVENMGEGRLVDGQRRWDPLRDVFVVTPSIAGITEALDDLRRGGDWRAAIDFARERDHARVFEDLWLPLLEEARP